MNSPRVGRTRALLAVALALCLVPIGCSGLTTSTTTPRPAVTQRPYDPPLGFDFAQQVQIAPDLTYDGNHRPVGALDGIEYFTHDLDNKVVMAIDLRFGDTIWRRELPTVFDGRTRFDVCAEAADTRFVYVTAAASDDNANATMAIFGLERSTGKVVWHTEWNVAEPGHWMGSCSNGFSRMAAVTGGVLVTVDAAQQYYNSVAKGVTTFFNADSGEIGWQVEAQVATGAGDFAVAMDPARGARVLDLRTGEMTGSWFAEPKPGVKPGELLVEFSPLRSSGDQIVVLHRVSRFDQTKADLVDMYTLITNELFVVSAETGEMIGPGGESQGYGGGAVDRDCAPVASVPIVACLAETTYGFDYEKQEVVWTHEWPTGRYPAQVVYKDIVYAQTSGDPVIVIDGRTGDVRGELTTDLYLLLVNEYGIVLGAPNEREPVMVSPAAWAPANR